MLGDGGVPDRCRESVAWVTMRVNAGSELTSDFVSALASRGAVRNAVLICSKNETRLVVWVNCRMNGWAAWSMVFVSTRFVSDAYSSPLEPMIIGFCAYKTSWNRFVF